MFWITPKFHQLFSSPSSISQISQNPSISFQEKLKRNKQEKQTNKMVVKTFSKQQQSNYKKYYIIIFIILNAKWSYFVHFHLLHPSHSFFRTWSTKIPQAVINADIKPTIIELVSLKAQKHNKYHQENVIINQSLQTGCCVSGWDGNRWVSWRVHTAKKMEETIYDMTKDTEGCV